MGETLHAVVVGRGKRELGLDQTVLPGVGAQVKQLYEVVFRAGDEIQAGLGLLHSQTDDGGLVTAGYLTDSLIPANINHLLTTHA